MANSRRYLRKVEIFWSQFAVMDQWKTSVFRPYMPYLELMITASIAGAGKSVIWYDNLSVVVFASLYFRVVLRSSRTSARCRKQGWHHSLSSIMILKWIKRGTGVG